MVHRPKWTTTRSRRWLAALLASLLAVALDGCATAPRERSAIEPPQRLSPRPGITPAFAVPTVRERMIFLARQEWELFGRARSVGSEDGVVLERQGVTSMRAETEPPLLARVLMYWYSATDTALLGYSGEIRPWSATFIVWLASNGGATDFPRAAAHWAYIEHYLEAGDDERFVARDPLSYSPQPGDLVCVARASDAYPSFPAEVTSFERLRPGPYHCDLVVERRADRVAAIGGNVGDAVALSEFGLDESGRLRRADRAWVVVLEQRDLD